MAEGTVKWFNSSKGFGFIAKTVEGLNNKAKVVSHRAYGFRSAKNYIRNLYHCMADLPMPQILHTFV